MTLDQSIRALLRHPFLRFGMVGAAGFVVDETVLAIFHGLIGLDPYSARVISILSAMTFTWWGNRTLTFAEHAATGGFGPLATEWFKFVLANGLGAIVNYGTYVLLVHFVSPPLGRPLVATAIGVAVGLVFNFTLSKRFVFRAK